ncbi:MAG: hypothetical protein KAR73_03900 [Spirochaetales bacterium]|nr:hypothetical protein [Spirochaetales bacterium]
MTTKMIGPSKLTTARPISAPPIPMLCPAETLPEKPRAFLPVRGMVASAFQ